MIFLALYKRLAYENLIHSVSRMAIKNLVIFVVIFGVVCTSPQFLQGMDSPTIWGNRQESDYDTNAYEADYFVNHGRAFEDNADVLDGNLALLQNPGW